MSTKTTSLALSRTPGESIRIGNDIEILVVDVHPGSKVRFRIRAPENVAIHRGEVYDEVMADRARGQRAG